MKSMITALYFDGYAKAEAEALGHQGVAVAQMDLQAGDFLSLRTKLPVGSSVFMRGPKLRPAGYSDACQSLASFGFNPTTTSSDYGCLSDSAIYEQAIAAFVPPKQIFEIANKSKAQEGVLGLQDWGRVFIRSELGSAAKFSGLQMCMIDHFTNDEVHQKIEALAVAFPKAEKIIARKVEAVKKIAQEAAEGRFVVLRGKVMYLDHCEISSDIGAEEFFQRNLQNAEEVASLFRANNIGGDYFLDIAEKDKGGWFVVEVKPAFNGTIRKLDHLREALLQQ